MNRRRMLRAVGAITVTGLTAGCTTLSKHSSTWNCGPGDDELGDVADEPGGYSDQNLSVEADIVDLYPGDGNSLVIHDSTGKAEVFPGEEFEYPKDRINEGNCMTGTAVVLVDRTEQRGHLCLYDAGMLIETYESE